MKSRLSPVRRARNRTRQGFALIATLSMMILLTLIAVGLLSLSTITVRSGKAEADLAIARANARLGLMMALSQLQATLGPDQRVTATADMATGSYGNSVSAGSALSAGSDPQNKTAPAAPDNSRSATDNGLVAVNPGTRRWTGAWGSYGGYSGANLNDIYKQSPAPSLLNWLISGNEQATYSSSTSSGNAGQITASNGSGGTTAPTFTPASSISGLSLTTTAFASDLKINNQPAALLVGGHTLANGSPSASDLEDYVVAPKVELKDAQNKLSGRYAYWVGDEGVKARINLVDPYANKNNALTQDEARYRLASPPRTGVEAISDFSASNYLSKSQSSSTTAELGNVVTLQQGELLDPSQITPAKLGKRFHSFTTYSNGLLVDVYRGGLKRDLTSDFSQAILPTWTNASGTAGGKGNPILPSPYSPKSLAKASDHSFLAGTSEIPLATNKTGPVTGADASVSTYGTASVGTAAPRWDVLYDYCNYYTRNQDAGKIPAQAATLDTMGIAPQLLQARFLMGVDAPGSQPLKALFTPLIVLGNPYSMPMNLSGLKVKFQMTVMPWMTSDPGNTWRVRISYGLGTNNGANINSGFMPIFPLENTTGPAQYNSEWRGWQGTHEMNRDLEFTLPVTTLQPGKTKIFSLKTRTNLANGASASVNLEEGDAADFASPYNFVARLSTRLSPGYSPTPASGWFYRMQESGVFSPVCVLIQDANGRLLQRVGGLNIDAATNSFGSYWESHGATAPTNGSAPRIIAAYNFYPCDPGNGDNSLRPYADLNLRASNLRLSKNDAVGAFLRDSSYAGSINTANSTSTTYPPPEFTEDLSPAQWGYTGTNTTPVFYDLPQEPLLSLGALQHANVTADDTTLNTGVQPAHAIGNSYAPVFLPRQLTNGRADDQQYGRPWGASALETNYYDLSYLLNSSLWDGYFFSSIPQSGSALAPANPRYVVNSAATSSVAKDAQKAASQLQVTGGFNVNSTSGEAWTALLAGMRNLPALPVGGASVNTNSTIFPRSLRQPTDAATTPTGSGNDSYSGFRRLSDTQVAALGEEIAKQVRLRGPFVSLAQFVNRTPLTPAADTAGVGFAGALQSAIDRTAINNFSVVAAATDKLNTVNGGSFYSYFYDAATAASLSPPQPNGAIKPAQCSTGIPGWLTQADILQAIGSVITVRSDTFVIRSYGEALAKDGVTVAARAWCEAVVQRSPDYLDPSDPAWTAPTSTKATNQQYGRRFDIVSFRWLTPDEI